MIENKTLGAKVRFEKTIKKRAANGANRWVESDRSGAGILMGFRTVQNGSAEYDHGFRYFVPTSYIKVALVLEGLYRNPTYVPIEHAFDEHHPSIQQAAKHISLGKIHA